MVSLRIPLLCAFVAFSAVIADHVLFPPLPPIVRMADQVCGRVYNATHEQCATEMENRWYDAGAVSYLREDHIKDLPICDRIAQSAANTCNQVGQGIALPGPAPKGDSQ